ncbi:hypothetical protein, partial [Escherichia coli]|uniref:hypothetical protein n=1 Tax=Escherichia coli TaxID=562 RepID=UPI001953FB6A
TQAASEGYATSTLHSAEYGQVFRVYQALLGHSPDAASYDSWTTSVFNGLSIEQMTATLMSSAEYQSNYGSLTNEDFVS